MKKNLTELVAIVDRSGSMDSVKDDAIGGFNAFLKTQKELPGEAYFTLTLFNDTVKINPRVPLKEMAELTKLSYDPKGTTALYDAICLTVDDVGKRLAAMREEDRPEKVIVAILTDGAENASKRFRKTDAFTRIQTQRDTYKWEFVFLAAGESAMEEARTIGMDLTKTACFVNDAKGNAAAYSSLCSYSKMYRSADVGDLETLKATVNLQSIVNESLDKGTTLDQGIGAVMP